MNFNIDGVIKLPQEMSNFTLNQMDVWFLKVDLPPTKIKEFETLLSPDEFARAHRFHFIRDRQRYIVQHGVLRMLLADYVGCSPRDVDIRLSMNGKPYLTGQDDEVDIHFSVSHSDMFLAFAFSRTGETGIDIEQIRLIPDMLEIVERHFTDQEKVKINAWPESVRLSLFYKFWTRKEAVLKVQGEGLLRPLHCVNVFKNGDTFVPWKLKISGSPLSKAFWVADVPGPTSFAAAVAAVHPIKKISPHSFF